MVNNNDEGNAASSQHDYYYAAKDESMDVLAISGNSKAPSQGVTTQDAGGTEPQAISDSPQSWKDKLFHLYKKEGLLIEVLLAIILARLYPKLGDKYLFPEISAHIIAVIIIFCKFKGRIKETNADYDYFLG